VHSFVPSDIDTPSWNFLPVGRGQSAPWGMEVRVFTAYPRRVPAAKAKVVYLPLEIWVRIVAIVRLTVVVVVRLIIGSANVPSMMRPDMVVS